VTERRILFTHYRVGKTDGVSIEAAAWRQIWEDMGARVAFCAGPISQGAEYSIENLEQQVHPPVFLIDEEAFGGFKTFADEAEFIQAVREQQDLLRPAFEAVVEDFQPTHLVFSNVFSVGEHIAAPEALLSVLDAHRLPTIGIHHDFYWEGPRYARPSSPFVERILAECYPPRRDYMRHACINLPAQGELRARKGIEAGLMYDTLDFNQAPWQIDEYNQDLLRNRGVDDDDLVVLQSTRIVRRKNIELAIDLVAQLADRMARGGKKQLATGKTFDPRHNRVWLVLAGYAENRDRKYRDLLMIHAARKGVDLLALGDAIGTARYMAPEAVGKRYTLWDAYPHADLITYPSEREGFGNQYLEALFAQKPVVAFEYPVFQSDIQPLGFQVISLGDQLSLNPETGLVEIPAPVMDRAVDEVFALIQDRDRYRDMVERNFQLGARHFSHEPTAQRWRELLQT
jgi:glycosyltransferase involved in cell wall biosynthesis